MNKKGSSYKIELCPRQIQQPNLKEILYHGLYTKQRKWTISFQKFHALPYAKLYGMLEYKLARYGIVLKKQTEEYTSQCSPHTPEVSKRYAKKSNRTNRGLYEDQFHVYNADAVGAYNIMRKYIAVFNIGKELSVTGLSSPKVIKVAV